MSALTEAGRKRIRDLRRERVERELRRHEWFAEAPRLVVSGFADLVVVSKELRVLMLTARLMRPDGEDVHPAVKAFREYKHTELSYLKQMVELRTAQATEPLDIVAQMAQQIDVPEAVEPTSPQRLSRKAESICPTFVSSKKLGKH
jgi:hypothetical protein